MEEVFTHVICPIANWLFPPMPFGICLRWKPYPVVLFSLVHKCGMWSISKGAMRKIEV